jgi:hypothetical protein
MLCAQQFTHVWAERVTRASDRIIHSADLLLERVQFVSTVFICGLGIKRQQGAELIVSLSVVVV